MRFTSRWLSVSASANGHDVCEGNWLKIFNKAWKFEALFNFIFPHALNFCMRKVIPMRYWTRIVCLIHIVTNYLNSRWSAPSRWTEITKTCYQAFPWRLAFSQIFSQITASPVGRPLRSCPHSHDVATAADQTHGHQKLSWLPDSREPVSSIDSCAASRDIGLTNTHNYCYSFMAIYNSITT